MSLRLSIAMLAAAALCAQDAAPDKTLQQEAAMGALMAQQFRERQGAVDLPEAQAYLERVVRELAAAQPGDGPCCTVALYARAEAADKPVTFPGGYLFVPAKLFFTSPDETAFVQSLAHAVAHVRQRDWAFSEAGTYASAPRIAAFPEGDRAESVPIAMRDKFEAREERADAAAARSAKAVTIGTGEFERLRDHAPLPTPRPSLLP